MSGIAHKKTGQRPRVGVVIDLRDDSVEARSDKQSRGQSY